MNVKIGQMPKEVRMARKSKPAPFHGLVLLDKPEGITSHDLVGKLRKLLQTKTIGHAGTLDPMATGLMVLLVGDATKFSNYILRGDKAYEAEVSLGRITDTWDRTGETQSTAAVDWSESKIQEICKTMQGELELPLPIFSAVKKDGKKLYEYAREGKEIEEIIRPMNFRELELLSMNAQDFSFRVRLRCEKGGYIRSWAKVFGDRFGCGANLSALRRSFSEPYTIDLAQTFDEFAKDYQAGVKPKALVPLENCLETWPELYIDGRDEKMLMNGAITDSVQRRMQWIDREGMECGRFDLSDRDKLGIKVLSCKSKRILALMVPKDQASYKIARVFRVSHSDMPENAQ